SMGAQYMDREGNLKPFIMGCYGWGVSRTMAAVVEQLNDEDGIIWPRSIAPYEVIVTIVSMNDESQKKFAESVYRELNNKGIEVVLDDREISPGMKFKDADLIGFPLRITVGKSLQDGFVELKLRNEKTQNKIEANVSKVVEASIKMLDSYDPQRGR
ncbi:His/Gly/Thr/Pro-type tRNA ligase C-terminal domain-containing protein, partial [Pseudothermotoga sp.]